MSSEWVEGIPHARAAKRLRVSICLFQLLFFGATIAVYVVMQKDEWKKKNGSGKWFALKESEEWPAICRNKYSGKPLPNSMSNQYTWGEWRSICSNGARLIEITNQSDNEAARELCKSCVTKKRSSKQGGGSGKVCTIGKYCWIGLRKTNSGAWQWDDSNRDAAWTAWAPGEPRDGGNVAALMGDNFNADKRFWSCFILSAAGGFIWMMASICCSAWSQDFFNPRGNNNRCSIYGFILDTLWALVWIGFSASFLYLPLGWPNAVTGLMVGIQLAVASFITCKQRRVFLKAMAGNNVSHAGRAPPAIQGKSQQPGLVLSMATAVPSALRPAPSMTSIPNGQNPA